MRVAIKVSNRRFVMLDAREIYYLESRGHDVLVRTAKKNRASPFVAEAPRS